MSSIDIKPENRGKFNATKKRTGKSTEELTHSKNPLTRRRAIFAQNFGKKGHRHADGGFLDLYDFDNTFADGGDLTNKAATYKSRLEAVRGPMNNDYDYYNYYLKYPNQAEAILKGDRRQHFTDEFKLPNHPTFSDESIYSAQKGGGPFYGGHWGNSNGHDTFNVSDYNFSNNPNLGGYFAQQEPGAVPIYKNGTLLPEVTVIGKRYSNGGGLSRGSDYGSKSKPYPSVDSSDFAGGGRSYPIPTKADAIDALRLAGLHGRSDVKAKVYKKYPELKHAYGGYLADNLYADGGNMQSDIQHGGVFNNGVTDINNGGTHEQNPYQGVPMGTDEQGKPNLVEQGEVVHNNYVYSNRLSPTKQQLMSVGLSPKLSKYSYSKIANVLNKESKERPNDPISKNGLNANMQKLQSIQEQTRNAKQQQESQLNQLHAYGGNLFADGGYSLDSNGNLVDNSVVTPEQKLMYNLANYRGTNKQGKAIVNRNNHYINLEQLSSIAPNKVQGNLSPTNVTLPTGLVSSSKNNIAVYPEETKTQNNNLPTWMRYAPIVGSGITTLSDMLGWTNKPNYSQANAIENAVANPNKASFTPVSNYLQYNPFDRNYYSNKLNAQAGATQRALTNQSNGNRATVAASLLANDYNTQGRMGDLFRQAEEYNQNQRNQVAEFNRGTNEFNSQGALQASQVNMANNNLGLQAAIYASQMRGQQDQLASQMRSNNLTNFLQNLGNLGSENYAFNQAANNRGLYYSPDTSGGSTYKGNQHSMGGKLKRKKGYTI